ncbi:MAG: twin-arginine translocase TatA/TatE family subunit [Deltaproteobacteria bacterium]|nr:twin-arginine translocase TatA/TatE family subunit [Deltaproteobacteria bacterium]
MFGLGIWELVLILLIVLVLFGRKLPDLGEGLGRGIRNFRKSMREPDEIDVTPKEGEEKEKEKEKGKKNSP